MSAEESKSVLPWGERGESGGSLGRLGSSSCFFFFFLELVGRCVMGKSEGGARLGPGMATNPGLTGLRIIQCRRLRPGGLPLPS